jgi:MFS family permease
MMLGVVASAQIGGRIAHKFVYRSVMLVSVFTLLIGTSLLGYALDQDTSRGLISLYMIIIGLGLGVSFSLLNILTLNAVPPQYKGSASSLIMFFRTIGSALAIAVFGAAQKHDFQEGISSLPNMSPELAEKIKGGQALLDPEVQQQMQMPANVVDSLIKQLSDSIIHGVFQWTVVLPAVAFVFVLLMGRARLEMAKPGAQGAPDGHGPSGAAGGAGKPDPSYQKG